MHTLATSKATFLVVVIASSMLHSAPARISAIGSPANVTAPANATARANATTSAKAVAAGAIGSANATTPSVAATTRQSKSSGLGKDPTCAYYANYTANPYFGKGLTVKLPPAIFGKRYDACYKVICAIDTKHCRSDKATVTVRVIGATTTEEFLLSPVLWSKIVHGSDATPVGITYKHTNCHSTLGSAVRVRRNSTAEDFNIQMVGLVGLGTLKEVEISADGKKWAKLTRDGSKVIWGIKGKEAKEVVGAKKAVSVRLSAGHTLEKITLEKVLPADWKPQTLYSSKANFKKLMAEAK